jgi:simple sugar transport system ATP-binding protein
MNTSPVLLNVTGITKEFPGVIALEDVDFTLRAGEVHALMGQNGAGKSTLIKILTGAEHPDLGVIQLDGRAVHVRSPQHSQELGISSVYQEVNLCTNLSVAENILLGREPHRFGRIDWRKMQQMARQVLLRLDIDLDVRAPLGTYSLAIQQMVAIARSLLVAGARILILDEPTSSLDAAETSLLFEVIRKLKADGLGIVFITHFLDQVYEIADRITVLRNGRLVGTYDAAALPRFELVTKMLGRSATTLEAMARVKEPGQSGLDVAPVMVARELGLSGTLAPTDLELRAGEVVGIAGLLGSGRTELASLLFGVVVPDTGSLEVDGKRVENFSPLASLNRGVGLCPEDRKAAGIIGELSIRENIILALQARYGWSRFLDRQQQDAIASKYVELLGIVTPSLDQPVKNLSGGNQQKVILARWLATNPELLILDEPTRGIDVGAKAEIQSLVLDLAAEGRSIVFISSELEEVLRASHRIVVLRERKKVAEYAGDVDDQSIMQAKAGGA